METAQVAVEGREKPAEPAIHSSQVQPAPETQEKPAHVPEPSPNLSPSHSNEHRTTSGPDRPVATKDFASDIPGRSEQLGGVTQLSTLASFDSPRTSAPAPQMPQNQRLPPVSYIESQNPALDRPLNVTDALSYLDAVKVQFHDQPDVYNHFLDIMKDFKSQLIDTPGVIKRVSYLFNGHPSLIQGFNTFLPPGYRIECSTDAHDSNFITVTTPTGTTMQTTNDGPGNGPILWSTSPSQASDFPGRSFPSMLLGGSAEGLLPTSLSPDPSVYGNLGGEAIEPAVQYVQKIKQRCDPETYKQFLEILSRYHHTPDTIDEREVSAQISRLFKDAPDLRSDFRIFMPEKSQQLFDDSEEPGYSNRTSTPVAEGKNVKRKPDQSSSSTAPPSASNLPQKRKRKPVERERERDMVASGSGGKGVANSKKGKQHVGANNDVPSYISQSNARYHAGTSSPRRAHVPPPEDETHFFDRVKRALDNRETYNEFLKVVNLFTQDYIDTAQLLRECRNFLGDSELMRQFKEILGWDERRERENWAAEQQGSQDGWVRQKISGSVLDRPSRAELNVRYGSYRKLPASEVNVTCSGRDEMCRSVLNDEWVSHPTWSSEDSGFVVHKKNVYEEALHRSEEERHEYDFHIEAIVRTIGMLEPINNKISQLSLEDRGSFKLKPNLGGSGKSIHHRVIKKIYGREAGTEVVHAMQESPALAIPVVLARLKQKEEEWKRAQREWNKVWREVDARNYQKSLDHQGISFKAADKKAISTKAFVNQIEAAREEQMAKRASLIDPLFARTRPRHQLEFVIEDVSALQDALKLTFSFLDRTQAQIGSVERKRIETFLRSFVPLFFMLDPVSFNTAFMVVQETADSEMSDDVGSVADEAEISSIASGSSRTGRSSRKSGPAGASGAGDLRKKLLKSEQAKSTSRKTRAQEVASPNTSRPASPAIPDPMQIDGEETANEPIPQSSALEGANQSRRPARKNVFFSNTIFYTLLRLVEVLYSRLLLFKSIGADLGTDSSRDNQFSPVAADLGLPSQTDVAKFGDRFANAEHFYDLMLESCERLFDNEIEQVAFEDQMRYMFGTKEAYKIFTIDKLIGALIKQVQTVFSDAKSQEVLELLKRDRSVASPTTQDQLNSRRNTEKVLGPDENLFRIDWLLDSKTMAVQLLGKDDSSFDDSEVLTGRWQAYIDSFVSKETTEGLLSSRIKRPFLRKSLSIPAGADQPDVLARGGMEIKVCVRTYRLFFVSNTEDILWRLSSREASEKASASLRVRNLERMKRLKWIEEGGLLALS